MIWVPPERRIITPYQQQQSAPHAALLMLGPSGPSDPFFADVVNLTDFDSGAGGLTNWATTNAGSSFTLGATASLSATQVRFAGQTTSLKSPVYAGSGSANAAQTTLVTPYRLIVGTDWTIEWSAWWDSSNFQTGGAYAMPNGVNNTMSPAFFISGSNMWIDWGFVGQATLSTNAYSVSMNVWHDYCVCKSGNTIYFFVDGALKDSKSTYSTYGSVVNQDVGLYFGINMTAGAASYFSAYRFTQNRARYTAAYTPLGTPFPTH